ncbi:MAG: ComF family protein [Betaproteobacteria bacterium]|jgi:predicted amidophosphoribosyltransferase|nr:ComF family protein [Betaproteobacteria bacterium]
MHPKALFSHLSVQRLFGRLETPMDGLLHWLWASPREAYPVEPGKTSLEISPKAGEINVFYLARYTPEVSSQIQRAKYHSDWTTALGLARLLRSLDRPQQWSESDLLLVPMAPDPKRLATRGFHLPALLAKALGRHWRIPVRRGGLTKTRSTPEQARRTRAERQQTEPGLIVWSPPRQNPLAPVILVDDVMTTGATLRSAAQAINEGGSPVLGAVVLAYVPAPQTGQTGALAKAMPPRPGSGPEQSTWHHRLWERTEGMR